LLFTPLGEPARTILRGGPGTMSEAALASRMAGTDPEGCVEGFGNLYRDAAHLIAARRAGVSPDPAIAAVMPTVEVGLAGLRSSRRPSIRMRPGGSGPASEPVPDLAATNTDHRQGQERHCHRKTRVHHRCGQHCGLRFR